jgi:hypothetical protein
MIAYQAKTTPAGTVKSAFAGLTGCLGTRFEGLKPKNKSNQYTDDILKSQFFITAYLWGQPNQQEKNKKRSSCENLRPRKAGSTPPPKGEGFLKNGLWNWS